MRDFRNLIAWQKASALEDRLEPFIQRIKRDRPALADQIDRAVASIPANIAEGRRKTSEKEFARFLGIAVSSSSELESHLIFARDAKLISETEFVSHVSQTIEVRKMLYALIKRLSGP